MTYLLVDMAPYLVRGKVAGFLTRLSATGLANVTSGGGQVPSFRVRAKDVPFEDPFSRPGADTSRRSGNGPQ
jgi:hypothetical protein